MSRIKTALLLIVMVLTILLVRSPSPTRAQFVIAGWDYPDEYGQGISSVYLHENSTGSWVAVLDPAFILPTDPTVISVNHTLNTALRLQPSVRINHTELDISTVEDAIARIRVGIEVTRASTSVFSQSNISLEGANGSIDANIWWISYEVVINVIIVAGQIYVVNVTYEIYQLEGA